MILKEAANENNISAEAKIRKITKKHGITREFTEDDWAYHVAIISDDSNLDNLEHLILETRRREIIEESDIVQLHSD